jgi:hypothetical protein
MVATVTHLQSISVPVPQPPLPDGWSTCHGKESGVLCPRHKVVLVTLNDDIAKRWEAGLLTATSVKFTDGTEAVWSEIERAFAPLPSNLTNSLNDISRLLMCSHNRCHMEPFGFGRWCVRQARSDTSLLISYGNTQSDAIDNAIKRGFRPIDPFDKSDREM